MLKRWRGGDERLQSAQFSWVFQAYERPMKVFQRLPKMQIFLKETGLLITQSSPADVFQCAGVQELGRNSDQEK